MEQKIRERASITSFFLQKLSDGEKRKRFRDFFWANLGFKNLEWLIEILGLSKMILILFVRASFDSD